jgi:hypothetical protein
VYGHLFVPKARVKYSIQDSQSSKYFLSTGPQVTGFDVKFGLRFIVNDAKGNIALPLSCPGTAQKG